MQSEITLSPIGEKKRAKKNFSFPTFYLQSASRDRKIDDCRQRKGIDYIYGGEVTVTTESVQRSRKILNLTLFY